MLNLEIKRVFIENYSQIIFLINLIYVKIFGNKKTAFFSPMPERRVSSFAVAVLIFNLPASFSAFISRFSVIFSAEAGVPISNAPVAKLWLYQMPLNRKNSSTARSFRRSIPIFLKNVFSCNFNTNLFFFFVSCDKIRYCRFLRKRRYSYEITISHIR